MGDHTRIKFWHDSWCGDQPLREHFLELFRLARTPESKVADHFRFHGSTCHWDIEFSRMFQVWEVEVGFLFMEFIYSNSIRRGNLDSLCWNPSSCKVFEVQSFYSVLVQPDSIDFLWRIVWKSKVPTKVAKLQLDSGFG